MGALDRIPFDKALIGRAPAKIEHLDAVGFEHVVGNGECIGRVIADTAIASDDPRSRCHVAVVTEMQSRRDLDVIRRTPDRIAQPPMNPAGTFKN
jgi:hypothetical protein